MVKEVLGGEQLEQIRYFMSLPVAGAQRELTKGDTFIILPFQQAPGTEEVVELVLLELASLSLVEPRETGYHILIKEQKLRRPCPRGQLMATGACSEEMGCSRGIDCRNGGSLVTVGADLAGTRAQSSSVRSCWSLKAPTDPPSSARGAVLAQTSSKPSNQALTLSLPACQGLNS